jgi:hypothetical protein
MRSSDKKYLKKVLDQIEVQDPSTDFEQRIYQDWQRTVSNEDQSTHRLTEAMVLVKSHPKIIGLIAIVAITASLLLGQHFLMSQDEELHRIDALSELSLSTI